MHPKYYFQMQTCREPTANEIRQWPNGTLVFACDPCSKEYVRKADWKLHVATHLRCTYPDCNFEAKSKILECHVSAVVSRLGAHFDFDEIFSLRDISYLQHVSKVSKPVTDADNAWISQRRQNFPVLNAEPPSTATAVDNNR